MTSGGGTDGGHGRSFRYALSEGDMPVVAILEAVSRVTGIDVAELDPLSSVVDPDALNDLFADLPAPTDFYRSPGRPAPAGPSVSFEYQGLHVTVTADRVTVDRI